ncbi:MAG: hypothetical protein LBD22_00485, partial [Spirochaetaceae bacterium]|nr:hypothetical protein [Spirochaetaceae bacterium]
EISQLLSEAKKKYNDGVTLIGKNRREEGVIKFAQAKEKTQEVKLMFPVNQDAGILELRIDQEIDPGSFEASFRQRFVTAVAGTKRGSREAYFELENLAQINPSYTGMQAALTEAKYDIGLLQRPVDTSTSNRAASMVTQARRLFSQGTTRNAEVIRLASEALALNPNNTQAMELLDRARLRVTAARGTVISDQAAEQEYLLAVQEFQQGRTLNALARMQRLLRNPGNQNNIRFNELLRRINALL